MLKRQGKGQRHGSHPGGGKCDRFLKNKFLCVSPKVGPAQPASPTPAAKLSRHFVHNLCLIDHYFVIYFRKESPVWTSLVIRPFIQKFSLFLIYFTQIVLESFPNLHPAVFLQSIGPELFVSSRTASDFFIQPCCFINFFDFDRTADSDGIPSMKASSDAGSDGIPPMKAFPQCRFGWHSSDGIPQ
jgi:hypothetical protein